MEQSGAGTRSGRNSACVGRPGLPACDAVLWQCSQFHQTLSVGCHKPCIRHRQSVGALGILSTGVAYILYFRIIERAGPARAISVTFVIPVFAVFYGVTLLDEAVTSWMIACAVVIITRTLLSTGLVALPKRTS